MKRWRKIIIIALCMALSIPRIVHTDLLENARTFLIALKNRINAALSGRSRRSYQPELKAAHNGVSAYGSVGNATLSPYAVPLSQEERDLQEAINQSNITYQKEEQIRKDAIYARTLVEQENEFPINTTQDFLPLSLHNKRIYYVQARQQSGVSCGYHSLVNARAIENLLQEDRPLSPQEIELLNRNIFKDRGLTHIESQLPLLDTEYENLLPRQNYIYNPDATRFATNIGLKNTYFVKKYAPHVPVRVVRTSADLGNQDNLIPSIKALTKNNSNGIIHVACALGDAERGGHWVYIGIVKQINRPAYMVVLDSCNRKINSELESVLHELYEHIE